MAQLGKLLLCWRDRPILPWFCCNVYAKVVTANGSFLSYCPPLVHVTNAPLFVELPQSGLAPHPSKYLKEKNYKTQKCIDKYNTLHCSVLRIKLRQTGYHRSSQMTQLLMIFFKYLIFENKIPQTKYIKPWLMIIASQKSSSSSSSCLFVYLWHGFL